MAKTYKLTKPQRENESSESFINRSLTINSKKFNAVSLSEKIIKNGGNDIDIKSDFETEYTFHFPIPNTINDVTSAEWNVSSLTEQEGKFAEAVGGKFAKKIKSLVKQKKLSAMSGHTINPKSYQTFDTSKPRSLSLLFSFVPSDYEEGSKLKEAFLKMKSTMSPTSDAVFFFGSPNVYELSFGENTFLTNMIKFDLCVLTSFTINYGTDGYMSLYDSPEGENDAVPKQMSVSLVFSEFIPKTEKDWKAMVTK